MRNRLGTSMGKITRSKIRPNLSGWTGRYISTLSMDYILTYFGYRLEIVDDIHRDTRRFLTNRRVHEKEIRE